MRGNGRPVSCLGCATVLVLLVAILCIGAMRLAPPVVRNVLDAYRNRLLDAIGQDVTPEDVDESNLGFWGAQLTDRQKTVYLQLLGGVRLLEESFAVFETDADDIDPAYRALMRDHPELFWLDGSCSFVYSRVGSVATVTPGLSMSLEDVPDIRTRVEAAADEVLAGIPDDASEYDVVQAVYEYVIDDTEYVPDAEQSQNIQSVLLNHASVCAGYARTFQYLLQRTGMFCAYVEGAISTTGEEHAWNLVRVGDVYAYVDATWGDPTYQDGDERVDRDEVIYDYLGLTTDEMLRDHHVFAEEAMLPACNSSDLDYYRRIGLVFDAYDEQQLANAFWAQAGEGSSMAAFKFSNEQAFNEALQELDAGDFLTDDLLSIASERGDNSMQYRYVTNDELRIIKLYW